MSKPPWLIAAEGELGVCEIPGPSNSPRIVKYHASTTLKATQDSVPWCSAFANWCMQKVGMKGTGLANARSWLKWGKAIAEPVEGCVVVFKRGRNPKSGHVGFVVGDDGETLRVLGGNQGDMVKVSRFKKADVLGYRWPKEVA